MKTLYQVLQVAPDASPDIIRMAHRVLAARFHPDNLQTGNSQAFREVNEAFEVLKNAGDRAHYDAEMTGFVPQEQPRQQCPGPNHATPPAGVPIDKILVDYAANVARGYVRHIQGADRIIERLKPDMLETIRAGMSHLQKRFGGRTR
jgi:curved DNA-binding protein CbpA